MLAKWLAVCVFILIMLIDVGKYANCCQHHSLNRGSGMHKNEVGELSTWFSINSLLSVLEVGVMGLATSSSCHLDSL